MRTFINGILVLASLSAPLAYANDFVITTTEEASAPTSEEPRPIDSMAPESQSPTPEPLTSPTGEKDFFEQVAEKMKSRSRNHHCLRKVQLLLRSENSVKRKFSELQEHRRPELEKAKKSLEMQNELIEKVSSMKAKYPAYEKLYEKVLASMSFHRDALRKRLASYDEEALPLALAQQKSLKMKLTAGIRGTKGDAGTRLDRGVNHVSKLVESGEVCGKDDFVFGQRELLSQYNDFDHLKIPNEKSPFNEPVLATAALIEPSGSLSNCASELKYTMQSYKFDLSADQLLKVLDGPKPVTFSCSKNSMSLLPRFGPRLRVDAKQRQVELRGAVDSFDLKPVLLRAAGN